MKLGNRFLSEHFRGTLHFVARKVVNFRFATDKVDENISVKVAMAHGETVSTTFNDWAKAEKFMAGREVHECDVTFTPKDASEVSYRRAVLEMGADQGAYLNVTALTRDQMLD